MREATNRLGPESAEIAKPDGMARKPSKQQAIGPISDAEHHMLSPSTAFGYDHACRDVAKVL
jgi:hypothetical protein